MNNRARILTIHGASAATVNALALAAQSALVKGGKVTYFSEPERSSKYPGIMASVYFDADANFAGTPGHILSLLPPPSKVFSGSESELKRGDFGPWLMQQRLDPPFIVARWFDGEKHHIECYTDFPIAMTIGN